MTRIFRNHNIYQTGECHVLFDGEYRAADFEIGTVENGRQRVFAGHYVKVTLASEDWLAEDSSCLRSALYALGAKFEVDGGTLLCAGIQDSFSESGLSYNSGYGYVDGYDRTVHMMEMPKS